MMMKKWLDASAMVVGSVENDKDQSIQCISYYWSVAICNSRFTIFYYFNKLIKYIIFLTRHLYNFTIKPSQIPVTANNSFIRSNVMKNIVDCFTKIYLVMNLYICKRVMLSVPLVKFEFVFLKSHIPSWEVGGILLNLWNTFWKTSIKIFLPNYMIVGE